MTKSKKQVEEVLTKEDRDKIYDRHAHLDDSNHLGAYLTDFSIEKLLIEQQFKLDENHF